MHQWNRTYFVCLVASYLCWITVRWFVSYESSFFRKSFRTRFTASLVCLSTTWMLLLAPQSHDYSCYVRGRLLVPPPRWSGWSVAPIAETMTYAHTTSRTLPTCDIHPGWLTLPALEAGDFAVLLLLYPLALFLGAIYTLYILDQCFLNGFARGPLLALKNNHRSSHLADVNMECPDGMYPKLKIYISELILDRY
jgi:hypothetical protein